MSDSILVQGGDQGEPDPSPSIDREAIANVLYGDPASTHGAALREIETAALEALQTPEQAKEAAAAWVPVLGKYQMSPSDASGLASAVAQVTRGVPDDDQLRDWNARSMEWLRSEFGDSAGQVLADTKKLIAADKNFSAHLSRTGLGSHPYVIRALSSVAIARRKAGRL